MMSVYGLLECHKQLLVFAVGKTYIQTLLFVGNHIVSSCTCGSDLSFFRLRYLQCFAGFLIILCLLSRYFTPIINRPEVAILGVSRGAMEPVWNPATNAFEPRQKLPLSLSYDHRLIDGADAMRFLRWVVEAIEQPFLLSLIG